MALASTIRNDIKQFPEGKTFGYTDLNISKNDYLTAAKALERFQKEGLIKKVSNRLKSVKWNIKEIRSQYKLIEKNIFDDYKSCNLCWLASYKTSSSISL